MTSNNLSPSPFDFDNHRRIAVEAYQKIRGHYEEYAAVIKAILKECLAASSIKVASIEARAKSVVSFGEKAEEPSTTDPNKPKYANPPAEITDLAGVRVITFFPKTVEKVDQVIEIEFSVIERSDKAEVLKQEERFGYQSIHYLVTLGPTRTSLPEYRQFKYMIAEIQVRTILQHAWAEIEHDIQYKSVETIPKSIRRRFMSLAGLLEIADREFQAIQDEDERLTEDARVSVREGRLESVEVTPDALRAYLDEKLGPDGRVKTESYSIMASILRNMGFTNFHQIDECVAPYNDDTISRTIWGVRQGQLSRFEAQLLAGMGENFMSRHPWAKEIWFMPSRRDMLKQLQDAGIEIGNYVPALSKNEEQNKNSS